MNQNEQDKNADTNLTDLEVGEPDQAKIKGGPKKIFIGGLSATETEAAKSSHTQNPAGNTPP
jgi:hypothetical protein